MEQLTLIDNEINALVDKIKLYIKQAYKDNNYVGYVLFNLDCKPKRFDAICLYYDTIFLRDDDGYDYHINSLTDINELYGILMAMYALGK
jgi:hypothetical protein